MATEGESGVTPLEDNLIGTSVANIDGAGSRVLRVAAVQTGPASGNLDADLGAAAALALTVRPRPDLIVLPEMFSRPFWCIGLSDPRYLEWAEPVDGPTVTAMRAVAKELQAHVVVPFFERGNVRGEQYNSAVLLAPSGEILPGLLPSGRTVRTYRKNAVSAYRWGSETNDEKFYFRPGDGFPVFGTAIGRVGILICYDRWYPEAWRMLALQGAEVVCVVNASTGESSDMFVPLIRVCAAQNVLFSVAVNRAGVETIDGTRTPYFGSSCLVDPSGVVMASADGTPEQVVCAEFDLDRVAAVRMERTMYRDRRPELYRLIASPEGSTEEVGSE